MGRSEEESACIWSCRVWGFWVVASPAHQLLPPQHVWPCRRTGKGEFPGTDKLPTQVGLWKRKYRGLVFPRSSVVPSAVLSSTHTSSRCEELPARYFSNRWLRENMYVGLHVEARLSLKRGSACSCPDGGLLFLIFVPSDLLVDLRLSALWLRSAGIEC